MKKIVLIVITLVFSISFSGCSVESDGPTGPTRSAKWSLVRVTEGVAGTQTNLELGQITWIFDEVNNIIIVEENVEGLSFGLTEGNYPYIIESISNADFLFVEEIEYGDIIISTNTFTIDQNRSSTNPDTADKFIYRFAR